MYRNRFRFLLPVAPAAGTAPATDGSGAGGGAGAPTPNAMPGAAAAAAAAGGQAPPASPAAVVPAAGQAPPAAPPAAGVAVPPWEASGEDFDPARAWSLVQSLRAENEAQRTQLAAARPVLDAAEQTRRTEQGELATLREDLTRVTERESTWRAQAVQARAEAMAAGRFIDTDTALALIGDLSGYATDNEIDTQKLQARLDQLATDKPFLLANTQTPPPAGGFTPNRGQGQSGNAPLTTAQQAAHAETQQDWKTANTAKAQQLIDLRSRV